MNVENAPEKPREGLANPASDETDRELKNETAGESRDETVRGLKEEIRRLETINEVLVRRAEQDMDNRPTPFTYFFRTVLMEKIVNKRNRELMESNRMLTETNMMLTQSRQKLTEEVVRRKAFEAKLRQSKDKAENADRSKTRFLASATHDLLQPLNSARLFLYSLKQINLPENAAALIHKAEKSIELAGNMIKTTLDISKIDSGMISPNIGTFPIASLFEDLREEFELAVRGNNLRMKTVPTSFRVKTDPVYMHCVLQNLVCNAIRFTGKGKILIGCKRKGRGLEILVADTGIGIKKRNIDKIFDEFYSEYSIKAGTNGEAEGTRTNMGLGLSIVKRLVSLLGLSIEVSSTPKKGTLFRVGVPGELVERSRPTQDRNGNEAPKTAKPLFKFKTIFCVENDPETLRQLTEALKNWGESVSGFTKLSELRKAMKKFAERPDFIIADYHLSSRTNGIQAINETREFFQEPFPAVLVSADLSSRIRNQAKSIGAEFAEKPLNLDLLHLIFSKHANPEDPPSTR